MIVATTARWAGSAIVDEVRHEGLDLDPPTVGPKELQLERVRRDGIATDDTIEEGECSRRILRPDQLGEGPAHQPLRRVAEHTIGRRAREPDRHRLVEDDDHVG